MAQGKKRKVFSVTTLDMKDTILATWCEKQGEWNDIVQARIMQVHYLPAADAVYHQTCGVNFHTGNQIPKMFMTDEPTHKKKKVGE